MNGQEQVVRLAHIDCPEKKQPFGNKAKEFVSQQSFGKQVSLVHQYKYDRNRRLIAEVILADGRNLNKELVKNGLAWHFKKYSDDKVYAALEEKARKAGIGLWKERGAVAPWEWRRPVKVNISGR
ncbi:thermonuclease family protein [Niabella hibiscisoli]|uniref:thermonuclease family protein n=1 Tax=Niabella hibiscisoli TaxID=1825928 RepID=UPI001F0EB6B1|nr:thermonuclease family protein [Niabella hibiscisoli]MCH5718559.1 thermonuclease family protein [Niabella hibiscisoli]